MFSGLVYCKDCGQKLYYSSTGNYKREQANFFCSTYRKDSDKCSVHYIREKVLYELVLEDMRQVFEFVTEQEDLFARIQMYNYGEEQRKALKSRCTGLKTLPLIGSGSNRLPTALTLCCIWAMWKTPATGRPTVSTGAPSGVTEITCPGSFMRCRQCSALWQTPIIWLTFR